MGKRKAKEILLAKGFTEEELKDNVMLNNPKFCQAIEDEAAVADEQTAEARRLLGIVNTDREWYNNTVLPEIETARQDAIAAHQGWASERAKVEQMQKYGMARVAQQGDDGMGANAGGDANSEGGQQQRQPQQQAGQQSAFDESKYVQRTDFNTVINNVPIMSAMLQDISDMHRDLFGKSIPGGTAKLYKEFEAAQQNERFQGSLQDFWSTKYKVEDKREEIRVAEQTKRDNELREEGRRQALEQVGQNPNLRSPVTSNSPFTNKIMVTDEAGKRVKASQPWESQTPEQRANARVSKFAAQAHAQSVH